MLMGLPQNEAQAHVIWFISTEGGLIAQKPVLVSINK